MENKLIFDLKQQLIDFDIEGEKLDAVIQLKTWQKKMVTLIEKIYLNRLNEIDRITLNTTNEIKDKQNQLEQISLNDKTMLLELQHEIDQLKSNIIIEQNIPDNVHRLIERTIHVKQDFNEDDDLVIVDIDKDEEQVLAVLSAPPTKSETRVSKILNSEPVQQALAVSLANTLTHMGTIAATSTTTIAATTMAKTALFTTACSLGTIAYGMGRIAMGTTKMVWSLVVSSDT